ncbi:MAG: hypothetical protein GY906_09725 [bacterium]|nr:hypothetical protein [bacterium]
MWRDRFFLSLAVCVGLALAVTAHAAEPRLEWGPADGSWKVSTSLRNGQRVGQSGSGTMNQQLRRSFLGEGYSVGPDGDGPLVEFDVREQPIKTLAQCEDIVPPGDRRFYHSVTCSETTFQGLPAIQMVGVLGPDRHEQVIIEVEASTNPPRTLVFVNELFAKSPERMARHRQKVEELLSTFRIIGEAAPARIWTAEIRYLRDLKPGDVLSPIVVITDQDGKSPSEPIQVSLLINRQWANSITWDGSRTEIEAQVSVDHQAVVANTVVPRYHAPPVARPTAVPAQPPDQPIAPQPIPSTIPSAELGEPAVKSKVTGLGGAGDVPGPRSTIEGVASVVGPAGLGLLGALLSGLLGGGQAPPTAPDAPPQAPPADKPRKKARRRKKKEPDEPSAAPPPKPKPGPSKERAEKRRREAEKAKREAAAAASVVGTLKQWAKDIQKDFKETGETIDETFEDAQKGLKFLGKRTAEETYKALNDPKGTLNKIVEGTKEAVEKTVEAVKKTGDKVLNAGYRAAKNVYEDPQAALDKLKNGAKGLWKSFEDFITDPQKVWKAIKENTGISNFENALDPNRSLLDRFKEVGIGVFKLYGTITTVQAVGTQLKAVGGKLKNGLTTVVKKIKGVTPKRSVSNALKKVRRKPPVAWSPKSRARMKALKEQMKRQRKLGGEASGVREMTGPVNLEGITEKEQKFIQAVADKHGVRIHVRPRGKLAQELIEEGKALPKPEAIKAKTVKKIDTLLGYSDESIGTVACKPPNKLPLKKPSSMSKRQWRSLRSRHAQRAQEYRDQAAKLGKLEKQGKITWNRDTGVVYDKATGKPFTGDHDMLLYTDPQGNPVTPAVREGINRDMLNAPHPHCPGRGVIEHREHMGWDLKTVPDTLDPSTGRSARDVASGIKQVIIDSHAPGKEPLTCFNPDNLPSHTWYVES